MTHTQSYDDLWKIILKLIAFVLAALVVAMAGYLLLMGAFPFFARVYLGALDWNMFGGYISVVSLALVVGGLTFAAAEYTDKENAKRREKAKLSFDIYQTIFKMLTAPEHEAARRWILENIQVKKDNEDLTAWYQATQAKIMTPPMAVVDDDRLPEGQTAVKLTLNCFDYIGFIANHYWDIDADSLDWVSPPIAKIWKRIGPYVSHTRTLRKASDYYLSAEEIGLRCIRWRKSRGLPDEEYVGETL